MRWMRGVRDALRLAIASRTYLVTNEQIYLRCVRAGREWVDDGERREGRVEAKEGCVVDFGSRRGWI